MIENLRNPEMPFEDTTFVVADNREVARDTYLMVLEGETGRIRAPGQFINIRLDGLYLRRPMSICDFDDRGLTIIYKVVGIGTEQIREKRPGDPLQALCPLGNGFDLERIPDHAVLVGGGAGAMPMVCLARMLRETGKTPHIIVGFNVREEAFYLEEFRRLDPQVTVALREETDGEPLQGWAASWQVQGMAGTVVDALRRDLGIAGENGDGYVCACGPHPMLEAVARLARGGQYDLSTHMACGFGACMGCTIETRMGPARICREGPIFDQEEILWD